MKPVIDADTSLELSGEQLRGLVDQAMDHLAKHLDSLPDQAAWSSEHAAEMARSVIEPLPGCGMDSGEILELLFDRLLKPTYNTAGPGYLAYIPGGGLPHSAVADLISDIINRYVGVWIAAPALAQIEATVIRWFCQLVDFPAAAGGILTSGGSLANWTALVTARQCCQPEDFQSATLYTSSQAHHSVQKAAIMAGIAAEHVRQIDVDDQFRVRVDRMAEQIAADLADGKRPLAIVGHAGTVNTGAVDRLDELADLAGEHNVWLHVDGAYGGFFLLTERGRRRMRGIQRADSLTLDPHKGLFLPYGTGCLLVRELDCLRRAHAVPGEYMPAMQQDSEFVDFCQISPELSRDFRGLRLWLPIKMHGIEPFRRNLDEKLDLARWVCDELKAMNDRIAGELRIVAEPQLSIVAFRLLRPGLTPTELDRLNMQLRERINAARRVLLTPTTLEGRYVIRICILHFRTHQDRIAECLELIRRSIDSLP